MTIRIFNITHVNWLAMGNVGEPQREIEFEPIEEPITVPEPEQEPVPEEVPA
jgi:hypothetical protein